MKRLIYILLLVIGWNTLTAQTYQVNNQKIRFMNALGIPAKDTAAANWANAADTSIILIRPGDSTLWYRYKGSFRKVGTGGGTAIVDTVNTISSKPWRQKGVDSVSALISPRITDSLRALVRLRASGSGGIQLQNSVGTNVADFGIANTTNGSIAGGWNVGGNLSVTGTSGFTGKATFSDSIVGGIKRLSPPANSTPLTISGYRLTGSSAVPAVDISGTWNTTGTPTLIRANVTNTASNANSNILDLQTGGVSQFRVRVDGRVFIATSEFFSLSGSSANSNISMLGSYDASSSETFGFIRVTRGFSGNTGTSRYCAFLVQPTISSTASVISRGFYSNPTLTAAADWRSFEWSNNTGWGLYGTGTANNSLGGRTLLGTTTDNGVDRLQVNGSASVTGSINGTSANLSGILTFAGDTRYGVSKVYNSATGDIYGIEQVNSSQTGGNPSLRLITSSAANAEIVFGKYTDATSFTRYATFLNNGNFGINRTTPSFLLDVNGTFGVSGAATFASSANVQGALTATAQGNNITVGVDSSVTSTSYTLVLGDAGYLKRCSNASAITITVPTNASVAFPIGTQIFFSQKAAGKVTLSPASGVNLISEGNLLGTAGQHAVIGILKVNTNDWLVIGNRG